MMIFLTLSDFITKSKNCVWMFYEYKKKQNMLWTLQVKQIVSR